MAVMDSFSTEDIISIFHIEISDDITSKEQDEISEHYEASKIKMKKIAEAYNIISRELNAFNSEESLTDILLLLLTKDHRTLQQSFWRAMMMLARKYSKLDESRYSDLRNKASLEACKEIARLHDEGKAYLPMV